MSDLPDGWDAQPLGGLAALKTGPFGSALHKSDYTNGGIPIVNPMHIVNGQIIPSNDMTVRTETAERLCEFRLKTGDIVIGRRGEMGRCAAVEDRQSNWLCGTGSLIVRANASLYPPYLQRFLSSPDTVSLLEGASVGSTMVNLNQGILTQLVVPIPPVNEQKRIADKLDILLEQADDCRERLDRVAAILKRFRNSTLAAAVSGELTEDWREQLQAESPEPAILSDVVTETSYGTSAKSGKTGSVPVLRMGNIQNGRLDWSDLVYTSDPQEIAQYTLALGDVLFNRTNSPELVGKTAVYKGEHQAIYAGYLIRVRCSERLLPDYLNYCLNSPAGRDYCWRVKSDGVSQSNINAKKLAAFEFLLPSVDEQREIVRRVEILFAFADSLEARLQAVRKEVEGLTPALLAKAFRGELVPQDPNDEPASVLLERIRAARDEARTIRPKVAVVARRPTMPKMNRESVQAVIREFPEPQFAFDDLQAKLPGDYDGLKEIVFELLAAADSGLNQVFDRDERAIRFARGAQ